MFFSPRWIYKRFRTIILNLQHYFLYSFGSPCRILFFGQALTGCVHWIIASLSLSWPQRSSLLWMGTKEGKGGKSQGQFQKRNGEEEDTHRIFFPRDFFVSCDHPHPTANLPWVLEVSSPPLCKKGLRVWPARSYLFCWFGLHPFPSFSLSLSLSLCGSEDGGPLCHFPFPPLPFSPEIIMDSPWLTLRGGGTAPNFFFLSLLELDSLLLPNQPFNLLPVQQKEDGDYVLAFVLLNGGCGCANPEGRGEGRKQPRIWHRRASLSRNKNPFGTYFHIFCGLQLQIWPKKNPNFSMVPREVKNLWMKFCTTHSLFIHYPPIPSHELRAFKKKKKVGRWCGGFHCFASSSSRLETQYSCVGRQSGLALRHFPESKRNAQISHARKRKKEKQLIVSPAFLVLKKKWEKNYTWHASPQTLPP